MHSAIDPDELADLDLDLDEGSRLADLVRRHDEVVMALALAGPVLPMRLGTVLPDRSTNLAPLAVTSGAVSGTAVVEGGGVVVAELSRLKVRS